MGPGWRDFTYVVVKWCKGKGEKGFMKFACLPNVFPGKQNIFMHFL